MANNPRISVLVPIKDGEKYIARKIRELRNLDYDHLEIIISINKSADKSVEIASEACINMKNCKLFIQESALEIAKHFAFLLKEATANLVVFSAVDDSMSPDFLREAIELLRKNPELVGVSALALYENNSHGVNAIKLDLMGNRKERFLEFRKKARVSHSLFYCLTSKEILMEFSKRYPNEFIGRDWIFNIELIKRGKVSTTPRAYIVFGEDGVSRKEDTFKLQTGRNRAPIFPFRHLITSILRIAIKELGDLTMPLITFSIHLLIDNMKRVNKRIFANK